MKAVGPRKGAAEGAVLGGENRADKLCRSFPDGHCEAGRLTFSRLGPPKRPACSSKGNWVLKKRPGWTVRQSSGKASEEEKHIVAHMRKCYMREAPVPHPKRETASI